MTPQEWTKHLLDAIDRVADVSYQQRVWVEQADPALYDDPVECKLHLFDDMMLERFLHEHRATLHPTVHKALVELCSIYDAYPFETLEMSFDINDPKWRHVTRSAQKAVAAIKRHGWFRS